jgi:hypothetical protein
VLLSKSSHSFPGSGKSIPLSDKENRGNIPYCLKYYGIRSESLRCRHRFRREQKTGKQLENSPVTILILI